MTHQYAFSFDARFCSGCKACQAACKDKNNLPAGVLWRRVYEITGGDWHKDGTAWNNSVFAYNLSIACNHCVHPKCAGICPTNAFDVREDGLVILDESKCMGCGYCAWGCPYGVPQYSPIAGHMTKCNFCLDNIEQGLPPACVAACPLRVLDYADSTSLPAPIVNEIRLWDAPSNTHPYPLPPYSHTQPRLAIKQHPAMRPATEKYVANQEEIQPRHPSRWEEAPLMIFTLLGQLAVGSVWAMAWMFSTLWSFVQYDATSLRLIPVVIAGLCLGAGMLASLAHLGTKKNAWRVFANLKHSSLSKEVFYTGLFGSGLFLVFLSLILHKAFMIFVLLTAAAGIGLVSHMARVYRLPATPGWNSSRTNIGFFVSAGLLGLVCMTPILAYESNVTGNQIPSGQWFAIGITILVLLLLQIGLLRKSPSLSYLQRSRLGFLLIGIALALILSFFPDVHRALVSTLLFVFVMSEEALGRWLFYRSRI